MDTRGRRPFSYRVHGLRFSSGFPLERIPPQSARVRSDAPEITLHRGATLEVPTVETKTHIDARDAVIHIRSRFGNVEVEKDVVRLFPVQGVTHRALFEYYAVYILAFLLHHRNYLTLHASAVEVDGAAIAFVGPKGMGKSTTASLFYEQGHSLLSDDLVACRPLSSADEAPEIAPGCPWMKLGRNGLGKILGRSSEELDRSVPGSSKRIVPADGRQPAQPLPLHHIYALGYHDGQNQPGVQVERMMAKQACLALLSNAFVQMFLEEAEADPAHLNRCATLCERVPVSLLVRPQSMDALPSVYDAVLDDLKTTRPPEA